MTNEKKTPPPIFVVSGGRGLAGNQIVQSMLIQFPENRVPVTIVPEVRNVMQVRQAVARAKTAGAVVVHTLVDESTRKELAAECLREGIKDIDLMGDLANHLTSILDREPLHRPGLYRQSRTEYYDRIEAIEFTISCDDGRNSQLLPKADLILTGVSRVGKTPLSMYLAMFGWKVANVPLVKDIAPPEELFQIDPQRVFGLTVTPQQLMGHRRRRVEAFRRAPADNYVLPEAVRSELAYARSIFTRGGFTVIDVTEKPVETTANEVVALATKRFPAAQRSQEL